MTDEGVKLEIVEHETKPDLPTVEPEGETTPAPTAELQPSPAGGATGALPVAASPRGGLLLPILGVCAFIALAAAILWWAARRDAAMQESIGELLKAVKG